MAGTRSRLSRSLAGLCASSLVVFLAGCDWFQGTENVQRVTPFLSGLSLSPASVQCGEPLTIAFRFDDPQNDISVLLLSFERIEDRLTRQDTALWDDVDRSVSGRASFAFVFGCDTPGGRWTATVQVEDNRGHTSNALSGEIDLRSPTP